MGTREIVDGLRDEPVVTGKAFSEVVLSSYEMPFKDAR
jgi:hypothetical protein